MDSIKGILSKRVSVVGAISAAILCGLLGNVYANAQGGAVGSIPPDTETAIISGNDYYKQECETVYEWDKDHWEAEPDKKIEDGVVYEGGRAYFTDSELGGARAVIEIPEKSSVPATRSDHSARISTTPDHGVTAWKRTPGSFAASTSATV